MNRMCIKVAVNISLRCLHAPSPTLPTEPPDRATTTEPGGHMVAATGFDSTNRAQQTLVGSAHRERVKFQSCDGRQRIDSNKSVQGRQDVMTVTHSGRDSRQKSATT